MNKNTRKNVKVIEKKMKKLEPLITKSSSDTWDISHSIAEELKKGNEYEKWLGQFLRDIYNNVIIICR